MNAWGYAFEEAWASIRRAGRSAAVSVGTIAIAFVALGGFLLVSVNLQQAMAEWVQAAELSVYLQDDITVESQAALESHLRSHAAVSGIEFVSKQDAFDRFIADFPELADVTTALPENPFPASFEVRLRGDGVAEAAAGALAGEVEGQAGVADVRFDRQWLARLMGLVTAARVAAAAVAGVLMLGAAFTVAAVVRLSLHARRDELDIMQLVGAPFSFIRGPAIVEGLLLGGVGAAAALAAVWALYAGAGQWLGADFAGFLGGNHLRFLGLREIALLLAGGLAVGAAAGALVARSVR